MLDVPPKKELVPGLVGARLHSPASTRLAPVPGTCSACSGSRLFAPLARATRPRHSPAPLARATRPAPLARATRPAPLAWHLFACSRFARHLFAARVHNLTMRFCVGRRLVNVIPSDEHDRERVQCRTFFQRAEVRRPSGEKRKWP